MTFISGLSKVHDICFHLIWRQVEQRRNWLAIVRWRGDYRSITSILHKQQAGWLSPWEAIIRAHPKIFGAPGLLGVWRNLLQGSVYELWDSFSSSAHQGPDVPCRYAAQPGTVCSGCSHGGTLLLEHRADILGWVLMGSVWIYTVGSTLLHFFHHFTYSSTHELDNEIWPSTDDY